VRRGDITVTLPKPMTSGAKSEGRFSKQDFVTRNDDFLARTGPWGGHIRRSSFASLVYHPSNSCSMTRKCASRASFASE
jgi:hypothetical protein